MVVFALFTACKPAPHSELSDFSPTKTAWQGQIVNGSTYIQLFGTYQGTTNPYQGSFDSSNNLNNGIQLTEDQPTDSLTQVERANKIREILAGKSTQSSGPGENNLSNPYGSNEVNSYSDKDAIIASIKAAAINQLGFSMRGLSESDIAAANKKTEITNITVPIQQPAIPATDLTNTERFVLVNFTAKFTMQIPKTNKDLKQPESFAPLSDSDELGFSIIKNYRPCFDSKFEGQSTYTMFYYFDIKLCNFAALNQKHKAFQPVRISLQPNISAVKDGGEPEYDQIWQDRKMVATFVFGKVESESQADAGTNAFNDFIKKLGQLSSLKNKNVVAQEQFKFRAIYDVDDGKGGTLKADIMAIHISDIGKIDYEIGQLVFGSRIGEQDIFMYNGHAGYGNNVSHIEKIIRSKPNKYVLFYLNGCNTYSYLNLEQDNYDVIANMKPSYFNDMADSSYVMLDGLLRKQSYKTLLTRMPIRQDAIVTGEAATCPTK